jgi:hypothetical protein
MPPLARGANPVNVVVLVLEIARFGAVKTGQRVAPSIGMPLIWQDKQASNFRQH